MPSCHGGRPAGRPLQGPVKILSVVRQLSILKILRLVPELDELIKALHIQWEHHPARSNSTMAWTKPPDQLVRTHPKRLPLNSHGYLNMNNCCPWNPYLKRMRRNPQYRWQISRVWNQGYTGKTPGDPEENGDDKIKIDYGMIYAF